MKKLKLFVMSLCAMFVAVLGVNATALDSCDDATAKAKVGNSCYADLQEAITSANANDTVYVLKDVNISSGTSLSIVNKNITLDLGTHELTFSNTAVNGLLVNGSTVTVKNGKIVQNCEGNRGNGTTPIAVYVLTSSDVTLENIEVIDDEYSAVVMYPSNQTTLVSATVTVKEDAIIRSADGHAITGVGYGNKTANVYGTLVSGNEYAAINGAWNANDPLDINIKEGAQVTGGVLQMSGGKVVIEGTVTNSVGSAVVITNGELEVKEGAVVKSTAPYDGNWQVTADHQVFDDGSAIFVEPTAAVDVKITGGEITSDNGYAISAPATNNDNANLEISIEAGNFESAKGGINIHEVESVEREAFISAGAVFLKNGESDESVLSYTDGLDISESGVIGTIYDIELGESENGTVEYPSNAAVGEDVEVTITPDEGYEIAEMTVLDENGEELPFETTETGLIFTMPEGAVTISVKFTKVDLGKADTTELEKAIAEAEKYLDDKKYDAKQVEALKKLIEEAKGLLESTDQTKVDEMVKVLADATTKVANTGDNIMSVIATGMISLAVIAGGIVLVRKNKFNN